jgi:hypothetical protein
MEPFKNIFNKDLIKKIATEIGKYDEGFTITSFIKACKKSLKSLEMKDRVRLISLQLNENMSGPYKSNIKAIIKCLAPESNQKKGITGFGS